MLGLEGIAVPLGFILTIASTIMCIVYGILNWNKGYVSDEEIYLEQKWKIEEQKVEETL